MKTNSRVTKKDVEKVAGLAKLSVNEEEKSKLAEQFSKTFAVIDELNELDTDGVAITPQVTGQVNVWREDKVNLDGTLSQEDALKAAHREHEGYFVVGRLID